MITLRTPSENILETVDSKDLFKATSMLVEKLTFKKEVNDDIDIFTKKVEELKSEHETMVIIHIYFEVFVNGNKTNMIWKCHRAKNHTCSQSGIEII